MEIFNFIAFNPSKWQEFPYWSNNRSISNWQFCPRNVIGSRLCDDILWKAYQGVNVNNFMIICKMPEEFFCFQWHNRRTRCGKAKCSCKHIWPVIPRLLVSLSSNPVRTTYCYHYNFPIKHCKAHIFSYG